MATTTKLLVCGLIEDEEGVGALFLRLSQLQASAHGPFSLLIVFALEKMFSKLKVPIDLPTYVFLVDSLHHDKASLPVLSDQNHVHIIDQSKLFVELNGLVVALFSPQQIMPTLPNDYRGCDILLSHPWPKHIKHASIPSSIAADESVSCFAHLIKPRYHFASGQNHFYQQLPYRNITTSEEMSSSSSSSSSTTTVFPFTRMIGLAYVKEANTVNKNKWLHALSILPLKTMTEAEIRDAPPDAVDSPLVPPPTIKRSFLADATSYNNANNEDVGTKRARLTEEPLKSRFDHLENSSNINNGGAFFFGQNGNNRNNNINGNNVIPPNPAIKTLFVGGLSREMNEQVLRKHFPTAVHVHKPPDKFFAFVDFATREAAEIVFKQSQQSGGLQLLGRSITVGWGKDRAQQLPASSSTATTAQFVNEIPLLLEPPTISATSLFIGSLPPIFLHEDLLALFPGALRVRPVLGKTFCFVDMPDHGAAVESVNRYRQQPPLFHEKSLLVGWAKQVIEKDSKKILMLEPPSAHANTLFLGNLAAETTIQDIELFLQEDIGRRYIQKPAGKDYAFVEFDSMFSASTCMQRLSNATTATATISATGKSLSVGWAKGRTADSAIADNECWFCLGSATVKTHLVLSIAEHVYLAMPRGAIVPDHVLIVPIDCVPNRLMLSADAKKETSLYEKKIQQYYEEKCDKLCVVFERTLRTRGRDHMQINLVPLSKQQCITLLEVFMKQASQLKINFAEVRGDGDIDDIVLRQEGGPCQEYFFFQIPDPSSPTAGNTARRFLYVPSAHDNSSNNSNNAGSSFRFPMLFGLEVIAEAIGDPKRGNWKNCLLTEEEELVAADLFKERFAPYDISSE